MSQTPAPDLDTLIPALKAGEAEAYRALVRELAEPLFDYACGLTGDADAAQDLVQQTFIEVHRRRAQLRISQRAMGAGRGSLRTFCFHVATLRARNLRRDRWLRQRREQEAAMERRERDSSDGESAPQRSAIAAELWARVRDLPGELAEVLTLRFRHGFTLAETAQVLALPEGTVSTRQREALARLRERMGERAFGAGAPGIGVLGAAGLEAASAMPSAAADSVAAALTEALSAPPPAVLAPPANLVSSVEAFVMAGIGGKTAGSLAAVLAMLLLIGGLGFAGWSVFGSGDTTLSSTLAAGLSGDGKNGGLSGSPAAARSGDSMRDGAAAGNSTDGSAGRDTSGVARPGNEPSAATSNGADATARGVGSGVDTSTEPPAAAGGPAGELKEITVILSGVVKAGTAVEGVANVPIQVFHVTDGREDLTLPRQPDGAFARSARVASASSGADGRFEARCTLSLRQPWPAEAFEEEYADFFPHIQGLNLVAAKEDGAAGTKYVEVKATTRQLEYTPDNIVITLNLAFDAICRVRDEFGKPLAGAQCWWSGGDQIKDFLDGRPAMAQTDAEGVARFNLPFEATNYRQMQDLAGASAGLMASPEHFLVEADGYATALSEPIKLMELKAGHVHETSVTMRRGRDLVLHFQDAKGAPLACIKPEIIAISIVTVEGAPDSAPPQMGRPDWSHHIQSMLGALVSDSEGRMRLAGLPDTLLCVHVIVEDYAPLDAFAEAGEREITLTLERKTPVELTFVDALTRAPLRPVRLKIALINWHWGKEGSDVYQVVFDDVPAGRYVAEVWFEGVVTPASFDFEVRSGEKLQRAFEVTIGGATLSGVVRDDGRTPLAGAELHLMAAADANNNSLVHMTTDANGAFTMRNVPPGKYRLHVSVTGFPTVIPIVDVSAEQAETPPVEIILTRGATLVITVPPCPEGAAWEYQPRVLQCSANGAMTNCAEIASFDPRVKRAGDRYTFTNIRPGKIVVVLESNACTALPYDGDPHAFICECRSRETVEHSFANSPVFSLTATARDAEGVPIRDMPLALWRVGASVERAPNEWYSWKTLATDADGRFTAHGLLPGRYICRASDEATNTDWMGVFDVENGASEQAIVLKRIPVGE